MTPIFFVSSKHFLLCRQVQKNPGNRRIVRRPGRREGHPVARCGRDRRRTRQQCRSRRRAAGEVETRSFAGPVLREHATAARRSGPASGPEARAEHGRVPGILARQRGEAPIAGRHPVESVSPRPAWVNHHKARATHPVDRHVDPPPGTAKFAIEPVVTGSSPGSRNSQRRALNCMSCDGLPAMACPATALTSTSSPAGAPPSNSPSPAGPHLPATQRPPPSMIASSREGGDALKDPGRFSQKAFGPPIARPRGWRGA
jgi:hypothetical protein